MIEFLFTIDNYLFFLYLPALLVGIFVFKELNSFVITSVIVTISEAVMHRIRDPLKLHIQSGHDVVMGRIEWFGAWIILYVAFLGLMYLAHKQLNQSDTAVSIMIKRCFLVCCSLQVMMYLVKTYANGWTFFYPIYQYGLASINVSNALLFPYQIN